MARQFSTRSPIKSPEITQKYLNEPYGSILASLESEFSKVGLIKIKEDTQSIKFLFGPEKILQISVWRHHHPSISVSIFDQNRNMYSLDKLMKKFDPEAFEKNNEDLVEVRKNYGLGDKDTPRSKQEAGNRVYLLLMFRQMISFLDSNKKALFGLHITEPN